MFVGADRRHDDAVDRRAAAEVQYRTAAAAAAQCGGAQHGEGEDEATHGCDSRENGKTGVRSRDAAGRCERSVARKSVPLDRDAG